MLYRIVLRCNKIHQLITALIRTSYRPKQFARLMKSIEAQTVPINYIVSYDDDRALDYIPEGTAIVKVSPTPDKYFYNLYCNTLKSIVDDSWLCFFDDDDYLINPISIEKIRTHLLNKDEAVICQFTRNGRVKPPFRQMDEGRIVKGYIGMPCIFLHHSHKDVAEFRATEDADYFFIKEVAEKMKTKFVTIPVVESPKRNWGKME